MKIKDVILASVFDRQHNLRSNRNIYCIKAVQTAGAGKSQ
jgi:hypothetical protein